MIPLCNHSFFTNTVYIFYPCLYFPRLCFVSAVYVLHAQQGVCISPFSFLGVLEPDAWSGTQWRFFMPCSSLVVFSLLLCSHLSKLHKILAVSGEFFTSLGNLSPSSLWSLPPKAASFRDLPGDSWESLSVFCFLGRELWLSQGLPWLLPSSFLNLNNEMSVF